MPKWLLYVILERSSVANIISSGLSECSASTTAGTAPINTSTLNFHCHGFGNVN